MPTLSFNVTDNRYDRIAKAIPAWNEAHPDRAVATEDAFAKEAFLEVLQDYLARYRIARAASIQDQLAECSDGTFAQITGLLG
jgi:hypothetical protein